MKRVKRERTRITAARKATSVATHREGPRQIGKGRGRRATSDLRLKPNDRERSTYRQAFELAVKEGNNERVVQLLRKSHREGDRRATYALATWYIHGVVLKADRAKAFRLLKMSAAAGIADASFDLARSYEVGYGTRKSPVKALECYIDSASKHDVDAALQVVRCVFWGIGAQRSKKLAYLIEDLVKGKISFAPR